MIYFSLILHHNILKVSFIIGRGEGLMRMIMVMTSDIKDASILYYKESYAGTLSLFL